MDNNTYIIFIVFIFTIFAFLCYYYLYRPLVNMLLNDKQKKFKLTLEDMADILEQNDIHYFFDSGTSLGCHREKQFIEHDEDIDLGIFEDISYQKIIEAIDNSNKFSFVSSYPVDDRRPRNQKPVYNLDGLMELCLIHNETNVGLDISKYYKKEDKYMSFAYNGKCSFKPRNRCEWLDPINLIQMEFLGRTYYVPDMDFITSRYGSDWNIPKAESYDDQGSIIN